MSVADRRFADAAAYAATMAPSLRPIAEEVVRRAELRREERVIDLGTGTGIAAAAARGDGRRIVGIDAEPRMLELAAADVDGVAFEAMDFAALRFDDGAFDVAISSHALLFADDPRGALAEWRRVVREGGRLSLSVPGPTEVTPVAIYADVYERHDVDTSYRFPTPATLAGWAKDAGWEDVATAADPDAAIVLEDEVAFRRWRAFGARGPATARFTPEQHNALTEAMLAATPRDADGRLRIPFGAIFLTARRPTS